MTARGAIVVRVRRGDVETDYRIDAPDGDEALAQTLHYEDKLAELFKERGSIGPLPGTEAHGRRGRRRRRPPGWRMGPSWRPRTARLEAPP